MAVWRAMARMAADVRCAGGPRLRGGRQPHAARSCEASPEGGEARSAAHAGQGRRPRGPACRGGGAAARGAAAPHAGEGRRPGAPPRGERRSREGGGSPPLSRLRQAFYYLILGHYSVTARI